MWGREWGGGAGIDDQESDEEGEEEEEEEEEEGGRGVVKTDHGCFSDADIGCGCKIEEK